MILNKSQARAVYSAMCEMNKVSGTIKTTFKDATLAGNALFIEECADTGQITITAGLRRVACYSSQAAFAAAYGLQ